MGHSVEVGGDKSAEEHYYPDYGIADPGDAQEPTGSEPLCWR